MDYDIENKHVSLSKDIPEEKMPILERALAHPAQESSQIIIKKSIDRGWLKLSEPKELEMQGPPELIGPPAPEEKKEKTLLGRVKAVGQNFAPSWTVGLSDQFVGSFAEDPRETAAGRAAMKTPLAIQTPFLQRIYKELRFDKDDERNFNELVNIVREQREESRELYPIESAAGELLGFFWPGGAFLKGVGWTGKLLKVQKTAKKAGQADRIFKGLKALGMDPSRIAKYRSKIKNLLGLKRTAALTGGATAYEGVRGVSEGKDYEEVADDMKSTAMWSAILGAGSEGLIRGGEVAAQFADKWLPKMYSAIRGNLPEETIRRYARNRDKINKYIKNGILNTRNKLAEKINGALDKFITKQNDVVKGTLKNTPHEESIAPVISKIDDEIVRLDGMAKLGDEKAQLAAKNLKNYRQNFIQEIEYETTVLRPDKITGKERPSKIADTERQIKRRFEEEGVTRLKADETRGVMMKPETVITKSEQPTQLQGLKINKGKQIAQRKGRPSYEHKGIGPDPELAKSYTNIAEGWQKAELNAAKQISPEAAEAVSKANQKIKKSIELEKKLNIKGIFKPDGGLQPEQLHGISVRKKGSKKQLTEGEVAAELDRIAGTKIVESAQDLNAAIQLTGAGASDFLKGRALLGIFGGGGVGLIKEGKLSGALPYALGGLALTSPSASRGLITLGAKTGKGLTAVGRAAKPALRAGALGGLSLKMRRKEDEWHIQVYQIRLVTEQLTQRHL